MEVYKSECREIIRRFLAHRLGFPNCIAGLDAALAGFMPRMNSGHLSAVRDMMLANNEVVMKEMERRGPPEPPLPREKSPARRPKD